MFSTNAPGCAYMSPLPKASVMAGERGLRRKLNPWNIATVR
jgi:hypothetical protein